jgi:hypothetical protein
VLHLTRNITGSNFEQAESGAMPTAEELKAKILKPSGEGGRISWGEMKAARVQKTAGRISFLDNLRKKTKSRKKARYISRNKDLIKQLVKDMTAKAKFGKMLKYSLTCLTNLCVDEVHILVTSELLIATFN